jgi:hypothetical protein
LSCGYVFPRGTETHDLSLLHLLSFSLTNTDRRLFFDLRMSPPAMTAQAEEPGNPTPSYIASEGSVLHANRAFYTRIAETTARELIGDFVVPIRSGRAWRVPAGHVCRISTPEGPQVGDLNIWNIQNPKERFWASRTKQLHAAHVSTFDRLWSCLPFLRPMVTITGDSLGGDNYGTDAVGGRVHDLLGTRCDPYGKFASRGFRPCVCLDKKIQVNEDLIVNKMLTGDDFDYHCHSNLTRAILPWGLTEYDVHDVINLFQVTGLNKDDKYFM